MNIPPSIECPQCGQKVTSLPGHRRRTNCTGKPKQPDLASIVPILENAVEFTLKDNYGTKCLSAFSWWLDEDACDENFTEFKYSYGYICSLMSSFNEQNPDYKCPDKNCEWCKHV